MRTAVLFFSFLLVGVSAHAQSAANPRAVATSPRAYPKATHPAEFPGGGDELSKYLSKRLRSPSSLLKAGIYPPPITASFVVAETGAIENVEIIDLRQAEYMRLEPYLIKVVNVLEKMPRWKPATAGNMAVASRHLIPVSIDVK